MRVKTNGEFTLVDVTVRPLAADADAEPSLFLVVFEESPQENAVAADSPPDGAADGGGVDARIAALKQELRAKEEYLETANEELATSNEELKSSNEEMQSVNEELQSTNEELETSKEELQSLNEEMATVNAELQQKVADLSRANNDMNNLMAGTDIGTVFVDFDLRIQRFTPAVTQLINLISTDVGRPVGHIVSNLVGYDRLVEDVKAVLDTLVPIEVEVQTTAGAWHLLRIRPYRTLENVIEGAVITFTDITETRNVQAALRESEAMRRLAAVVRDAARRNRDAGPGRTHPGLEPGRRTDVWLERSRGTDDEHPRSGSQRAAREIASHCETACRGRGPRALPIPAGRQKRPPPRGLVVRHGLDE